jgi:hypothetical protein
VGAPDGGINSIFFWFSNPVDRGDLALLAIAAVQNYIFGPGTASDGE